MSLLKPSRFVCIVLMLIAYGYAMADSKIIKWVDEKGVTHYGDKLPTQDTGRKNTILNSQGVAIRQNDPAKFAKPESSQQTAEQERYDKALLASYTTEEEIDLARDRSLQMDETMIQGLKQRRESVKTKVSQLKKSMDDSKKSSRPVSEDMKSDWVNYNKELTNINQQIIEREKNKQTIHEKFENDKKRFRTLKPKSSALADSSKQELYLQELRAMKSTAQDKISRLQNELRLAKLRGESPDASTMALLDKAQREYNAIEQEISSTQEKINAMKR